ncbi:MAG: cyclic-di-AMP receptor [Anaerolineaceae bacterium]|nr:cyclic-di-AMP receptor [Anaerolineaceae bacterium]
MKMIIAIVRDRDTNPVSTALTSAEFRVTHIASTGGFLRRGNSTLFIGVEDEKVEQAMEVIRTNLEPADDPAQKRATIFVLNVNHFTHF